MSALLDRIASLLPGNGEGFARAGLSVMAIRVGGAVLGLVAQILASRLIGAEDFGYYALALVWLLLVGHGATMGTNQLICRTLARYVAENDRAHAAGLLRFAAMVSGGAGLILALGAIGLVHTGWLGLEPRIVALFGLAFCMVPLIVLQDFFEAIARGLDKPSLGIAPAFLVRHLAVIVGVVALMALGLEADAITIMGITLLGLAASTLIQFLLVYRHIAAQLGAARPVYRVREWLKITVPLAAVDLTEVLFYNADILVLGLFVEPELLAYYFAATRFAQILGYVPYGITAATAQKYARLAGQRDWAGLQALIVSVTAIATGVACVGLAALWLLSAPLLSLFGADYVAAAGIIPILSLGVVLICAFGPGEDVLSMADEERICAIIFAFAAAANLVFNLVLIPAFGIWGAAIATTAALALRAMLLAWFAYRRLGLALPLASHLVFSRPRWSVSQ